MWLLESVSTSLKRSQNTSNINISVNYMIVVFFFILHSYILLLIVRLSFLRPRPIEQIILPPLYTHAHRTIALYFY